MYRYFIAVMLTVYGLSSQAADIPSKGSLFIYSGMEFVVPYNVSVIGSQGGKRNFVFFRYGKEKGKRYLAFENMTDDNSVDYGCDPKVFYAQLVGATQPDGSCNKDELGAFGKIIVGSSDKGQWKLGTLTADYVVGNDKSYLFLFSMGRFIKIDSDFMDKRQLRKLLSHYRQ